jgi:hypothetical protein
MMVHGRAVAQILNRMQMKYWKVTVCLITSFKLVKKSLASVHPWQVPWAMALGPSFVPM